MHSTTISIDEQLTARSTKESKDVDEMDRMERSTFESALLADTL